MDTQGWNKKLSGWPTGLRMAIIVILALLWANVNFGGTADDSAARKKARYFFMKGSIKMAENEYDAAHEYFKKAYLTDPTYEEAAINYGSGRAALRTDTLNTIEEKIRSMEIMRPYLDKYPSDIFNSMNYAQVALLVDSISEAIRIYQILEKYHPLESAILRYKASAYAATEEIDSALAAIRKYENIEGASFETTLNKVQLHLMNSDTLAVFKEMDALIEANPGNVEYVLCKGKVFDLLDMPDSAFYYLQVAERMDPDNGIVKNELAQSYAQRGDSVEYDRLTYEALLSEDLHHDSKMKILADYLQHNIDGNYDEKRSDKLFETISNQYPHDATVLELRARYAAARGKFKDAIEYLSYAMDLDKENIRDYTTTLMSFHILNDDPRAAMNVFDRNLRNQENDSTEFPDRAGMFYISAATEAGENQKAFDMFDILLKRKAPELSLMDTTINMAAINHLDIYSLLFLSDLYQMAGDLYFKLDSLPDAFRSYENAISIFPDNSLALNNYAYFLVEKEKVKPGSPEFEKAKEMSRRSLELNEDNPISTYLDTYAWILFKEQDYNDAEVVQKKAIDLARESEGEVVAEYYSHYGDILYMNGKPEEALQQWEKALQLEPNNEILKKKVKDKKYYEE